MNYESFIGLKYVKSKKRTAFISVITFISILGVMLGVASLCVVFSVMNGFKKELVNKILDFNSHALLFPYGTEFSNYKEVSEKIRLVKGIKSSSPIVFGQVMISSGKKIAGIGIKGISSLHPAHTKALLEAKHGKKGDLRLIWNKSVGDLPGVAIGYSLAEKLQVKVGDTVNLASPISLFGLNYRSNPAYKDFRVRYIFRFGMNQYDSKLCFIDLQEAQQFFKLGNNVSAVEILLRDANQINTLQWTILKALKGLPFRLQDWRQFDRNLFIALEQNKLLLGLILLCIILIASFNIAGTLILIVKEKTSDIAILRSMGASQKGIMRIFMTYGLYIGSIGTLAGVCLGWFVCKLGQMFHIPLDAKVYFIAKLPIVMVWQEFVAISVSALLICFLATVFPALQASKQNPIDTLRYE